MDSFRNAGAQWNTLADDFLASTNKREQPANEIRTLADWELALAGGGEVEADWQ